MEYFFKGVCPVINIPFDEKGEIDYEGMYNIIDYVINEGCKSVSVFAFNSEPHKMTFSEKLEVISEFMKAVNGRAETLVGIVENSIKGCIELAQHVEKHGGNGVILYPPALSTPAGEDLLSYFKSIAESINISVMVQDNPRSTGVNMSTEFIINAYNQIENFNYAKIECPIPVRKMRQITEETKGGLKCYSGNGGIFAIDAFLSGAWGIMPGVSTVGYFVKIYNYFINGEVEKARDMFENILPLVWYEDQSLEFYIACEKELLKRNNIIKDSYLREPGFNMDEKLTNELFNLYDRLRNY